MYDDYDDDYLDDEYDPESFDCGWTHEEGQLCDDAGSESCSFFCPYYQEMIKSCGPGVDVKPPTWAQNWGHPEWFDDPEIPF